MGLLLTLLYQAFGKSNGELNMRYLAMIQALYGDSKIENNQVSSMESKVLAIIQARMSSTRLPGKVLRNLCGQPILNHIIQRIRCVQSIDTIIIATSQNKSDDLIADFAQENKIPCFRGSEMDVLDRYFQAAQSFKARPNDIVMRLTADNPFVDPKVCEDLLSYFRGRGNSFSYAAASGYPLGVGAEVFTFRALGAYENASVLSSAIAGTDNNRVRNEKMMGLSGFINCTYWWKAVTFRKVTKPLNHSQLSAFYFA